MKEGPLQQVSGDLSWKIMNFHTYFAPIVVGCNAVLTDEIRTVEITMLSEVFGTVLGALKANVVGTSARQEQKQC